MEIGDIVVVKAGESFCCDGVIIEGGGDVDAVDGPARDSVAYALVYGHALARQHTLGW